MIIFTIMETKLHVLLLIMSSFNKVLFAVFVN